MTEGGVGAMEEMEGLRVRALGFRVEEAATAQSGIGFEDEVMEVEGKVDGITAVRALKWALSELKSTLVTVGNLMWWLGRLPGHDTERCPSCSSDTRSAKSSSSSSSSSSSGLSSGCSNERGSLVSKLPACRADWRSVIVEVEDVGAGL